MTYETEHRDACRLYGVAPLPTYKVRQLERAGYSLDDAYSVACDRLAGFTYSEALAAIQRARVAA
jgi:hypothetical protein